MATAPQRIAGRKISGSVPALSIADFDVTPFINFTSVEYQIHLSNSSQPASASLRLVGNKTDTDIRFQKYVVFAYNLNASVKLLKDGSETKLRIENTNAFDIGVSLVKTTH